MILKTPLTKIEPTAPFACSVAFARNQDPSQRITAGFLIPDSELEFSPEKPFRNYVNPKISESQITEIGGKLIFRR